MGRRIPLSSNSPTASTVTASLTAIRLRLPGRQRQVKRNRQPSRTWPYGRRLNRIDIASHFSRIQGLIVTQPTAQEVNALPSSRHSRTSFSTRTPATFSQSPQRARCIGCSAFPYNCCIWGLSSYKPHPRPQVTQDSDARRTSYRSSVEYCSIKALEDASISDS